MNTDAKSDFTSIGQLSARLQRDVRAIERAAQLLSLVPSLRMNGIAHFDADQVAQLTTYFREGRVETQAARLVANDLGTEQT